MKINGTEDARLTATCDKIAAACKQVFGLESLERTVATVTDRVVSFTVSGLAPAKNAFYHDDTKGNQIARFTLSVRAARRLEIFVHNNINAIKGFEIDSRMLNEIYALLK